MNIRRGIQVFWKYIPLIAVSAAAYILLLTMALTAYSLELPIYVIILTVSMVVIAVLFIIELFLIKKKIVFYLAGSICFLTILLIKISLIIEMFSQSNHSLLRFVSIVDVIIAVLSGRFIFLAINALHPGKHKSN